MSGAVRRARASSSTAEVKPAFVGGGRRLLRLGELSGLRLAARCGLAALVGLEQRIALELGLDVLHQLDIGELEQTDRLLQLGSSSQFVLKSFRQDAILPGGPLKPRELG